jgi:uncharacterized membrane protein YidH (DUF202 family)
LEKQRRSDDSQGEHLTYTSFLIYVAFMQHFINYLEWTKTHQEDVEQSRKAEYRDSSVIAKIALAVAIVSLVLQAVT